MQALKLLWTGGWDSTFTLLKSLVIDELTVQPYYLVDEERLSLQNELRAMEKIRAIFSLKFPLLKTKILPTKCFNVSDIEIDDEIENAYINLLKDNKFGIQYKWLSSFCKKNQISNMCLSYEKDPVSVKYKYIKEYLQLVELSGIRTFKLDSKFINTDFYRVFSYFQWPLTEISRGDMKVLATKYDFIDIMDQTWFCHNPTKKNEPCGVCVPCVQNIQKSFKYRIPKKSRIRYRFRFFLNSAAFKSKFPKLYKLAVVIKKKIIK